MRIAFVIALLSVLAGAARGAEQEKTVRVVYLVSKDREERADFKQALEKAITNVRDWYGSHLGGMTFKLHEPVVEVGKSEQNTGWFYSNENGTNRDDWGYNNGFVEAKRLFGAKYSDPYYVWVIYSDGPGDKGRGTSSVCVMPEDDLLGLIGKDAEFPKVERWIGGLAHEVGHAFGLPHPTNTTRDSDAIMWAGFYEKYPDGAYFTALDKWRLQQSSFFFQANGEPILAAKSYMEKYAHERGFFGKRQLGKASQWEERSQDTLDVFYFYELVRDGSFIFIKDSKRGYTIKLPINGGMSELTSDGGNHWQGLYKLRKE
jgi:hypothetical protein